MNPVEDQDSVTTIVNRRLLTATAFRTVTVDEDGSTMTRSSVLQSNMYTPEGHNSTMNNNVRTISNDPVVNYDMEDVVNPPVPISDTITNDLATAPLSLRPMHLHGSRNNTHHRPRQTEEEMFREVLYRGGAIFQLLSRSSSAVSSKLRIAHLTYNNRTFAVLTALVKTNSTEDSSISERNIVPFGCIFWQVSKSPPKAITITLSQESNTVGEGSRFYISCSCNPSFTVTSVMDGCCEHVKQVFESSNVSDSFRFSLHNQLESGHSRDMFGDLIIEEETFPIVHLLRSIEVSTINMERQTWSFYVQYDTERLRFIPLVKVRGKKIQCLLCRGHRNRRGVCSHETSWERSATRENSDESRNFDVNETDYNDEDNEYLLEEVHDSTTSAQQHRSNVNEEIEKYCPKFLKLPLLPCKEILSASFSIATLLLDANGSELLQFLDLYGICKHCGFRRRCEELPASHTRFRATKLFTMTQQVPVIQVEDWICPKCFKLVYFTGAGRAIFPVRKSYAYTYELLYHFVHNVCRLGISFRAQYESYRMTMICESARAHFDNSSSDFCCPLEELKSGRRRCAEAFRHFIQCIDTNNPELCNQLFTCKDCERDLTPLEKRLLGYGPNDVVLQKRFEALAIDGTTAGILHSLPKYERNVVKLSVNSQVQRNQRFISSRPFQRTVKILFKLIRSRLRIISNRRRRFPSSMHHIRFVIPVKGQVSSRNSSSVTFTKEQVACARLLLSDVECLCTSGDAQSPRTRHTELCTKIRRLFRDSVLAEDILRLLRSIISIGHGNTNRETDLEVEERMRQDEEESSTSEEEETRDPIERTRIVDEEEQDNDEQENAEEEVSLDLSTEASSKWFIQLNIRKPNLCHQFLEAVLDVIEFMLLDTVSIAYVRPCSDIKLGEANSEIADTVLSARHRLLFEDNGVLKQEGGAIGYDSFRIHENLAEALDDFADCQCNPRVQGRSVIGRRSLTCDLCCNILARSSATTSKVNPIFSRLVDQLLQHKAILGNDILAIASDLSAAIREHMQVASEYFKRLSDNLAPDCKEYWNKYASCKLRPLNATFQEHTTQPHSSEDTDHAMPAGNNLGNLDYMGTPGTGFRDSETVERSAESHEFVPDLSSITGMSFPGRQQFRPLFTFDQLEGHQCGKRYAKNSNHSPGLLTAQCSCSNPKLIGFIVMIRAESTSLALSIILMFFQIPPAIVLYDNGCNSLSSALLRIPWLLLFSFIIVDRFHYKGHSCNSFFDADRYQRLDNIKTSGAELINSKIKRALYHMRFLRGDLLVYYLNVRFALLNLTAKYYEVHHVTDVEDVDMNKFYCSLVPCSCPVTLLQQELELSLEGNASDG